MALEKPTSRGADFGQESDTGINVAATADSIIRTIDVPRGATRLFFEVKNSHASSVAFDQFTIKRRTHASGSFETIANLSGDYTSPPIPILEVSADPTTLAQNAIVHIRMDVEATDAVQILASGNGAVSTADIHWRMQ